MVEHFIDHGADVDRGQRSSSLHYAACFGRVNIAKALLRAGADMTLRDEDNKTPLEKVEWQESFFADMHLGSGKS